MQLVYSMSDERRQLIAPLKNMQIKKLVENIPPGKFLVGPNLSEKIQTLKAPPRFSTSFDKNKPARVGNKRWR